jgi:tellurite resistance protein TehA-like permease
MHWPSRQSHGFQRSAWRLLGHLSVGTLIFLVILFFAWALSFAFKYLNSLNPFPLEIAKLFSKFEIGLFYADIILSGVVLLVGVLQFMWDVVWKRDG